MGFSGSLIGVTCERLVHASPGIMLSVLSA